jgi:threonine dehydrogenase-like Zn-dependent dehydrogenase
MSKMKAGIYHGVGKITVEEIDKPEVSEGAIVVKNIRSGICGTDLHAYTLEGEGVGILPENQFGHEMSGIVDEAGEGAPYAPGTHVFVNPVTFKEPTEEMSVLMCCDMAGAFSQYVKVDKPQEGYNVFTLPEDLPWDVAAMIEPISVALNGILLCHPKKGQKAVIYGGGIIGLCALACLKYLGIDDVVVTARNPLRIGKVTEMGGIVCNTKETGVPEFVMNRWGKNTGNSGEDVWDADIVLDCAGYEGSFTEIFQYSKPGAYISMVALGTAEEKITGRDLAFKAVNIVGSFAYSPEVIAQVVKMVSDKPELFAPVATATYGLTELPEAFEAAKISSKNVKVLIDHSK